MKPTGSSPIQGTERRAETEQAIMENRSRTMRQQSEASSFPQTPSQVTPCISSEQRTITFADFDTAHWVLYHSSPPRGVKFKSKAIDFSDYYQKEQIGPQSYQYKCDLCRKIETNSYHIKHHIKDHIYGENKYRCTICNDAFFYPSELVNHLTRNHIDTHPIEKIQIEEQESIVNTSDQTTAIETPTTVVTASHTQTSASEPQPSTSYASPPKRQRKS